MGEVVLSVTGAATVYVPDGSSVDILFSAPITNNPATLGTNVLCDNGACPASMSILLFPPVNPTGLRIQFANPGDAFAATSLTPGSTITIAAVRTNASTILTEGASVTATMSGVSAAPTTNPITFTDPVRTVASLVNPETTVTFNAPIAIATCNPGTPTISTTVTERYPASLTTLAQETAFSNTPVPGSATQVVVVITGVPAGVTVTPTTATPTNGVLPVPLTLTAVSATAVVSTGAAITFTYNVTSSVTGTVEVVTIAFNLTTIGIVGTPQTVQMQDRLGPIAPPAVGILRFINNSQGGPTTVATIADCTTRFIFPWVLAGGATGYDTGMAIANTTDDDVAFGVGATVGATVQDGTCQLTGYNSGTGATVAATTASVAAGRTAAFLASGLTGWSGFSGYVLGVCNFTNAHAFTFIVNGFGTLAGPNLAEGYLALVVPFAGTGRNVVAPGLAEQLMH
jgi:hypothetical protein